jgi:alpha-tubulin suppressor-like RCC1 family protein
LSKDGCVFTSGWGGEGRLGHGDEQWQLYPMKVQCLPLPRWVLSRAVCVHTAIIRVKVQKQAGGPSMSTPMMATQVAAGSLHTAIVNEQGEVYTWGCGRNGQLGHKDEHSQLIPKQVCMGAGVWFA